MASGVKVSDLVKDSIIEMKVLKNDAEEDDRIRILRFCIKNGEIQIQADTEKSKGIYREKDLKGVEDIYKYCMKTLDPLSCCYLLYDCHFETSESIKQDLVFIMWGPDTAPIKQRMEYASSKGAFKNCLDGIKHQLQINDPGDLDIEVFADKISAGKCICKIESQRVKKQ